MSNRFSMGSPDQCERFAYCGCLANIFSMVLGPSCFSGGGDPTPAVVARRLRASQQLKAVASSRCGQHLYLLAAGADSLLARAAGAPVLPAQSAINLICSCVR